MRTTARRYWYLWLAERTELEWRNRNTREIQRQRACWWSIVVFNIEGSLLTAKRSVHRADLDGNWPKTGKYDISDATCISCSNRISWTKRVFGVLLVISRDEIFKKASRIDWNGVKIERFEISERRTIKELTWRCWKPSSHDRKIEKQLNTEGE